MDDQNGTTTLSFEWTQRPDVDAVARLLARIEDSGDIQRLGLDVEAADLNVDALVGVETDAVAADRGPHLDEDTKAFWAAVAIHGTDNAWTTAKELADLLSADDAVTRNNAHAYLQTLSSNRILEERTRATEGRGANPTEYRLTPEGSDLVESLWDDADDPPEGFRDDLSLGDESETGDEE